MKPPETAAASQAGLQVHVKQARLPAMAIRSCFWLTKKSMPVHCEAPPYAIAPSGGPNTWKLLSLLVSLCVAALFLHPPIQAENREIRRVLVFSEVGDSSPVIRLIDQGVRGALDTSSYQVQLYREYFETVLFPDATTHQQFS